jgi:hypothetical protein
MKQVFHKVFGRWPDGREIKVIQRLVRLYGTEITEKAIKLSCIVTNGSPVNYMSKVALELSEDEEFSYHDQRKLTEERLKGLRGIK